MSRSASTRGVAVLLVAMMGITAVVLTWPGARALTWTQDTDTDFNAGSTLNGVEVVGTGTNATVQLAQSGGDWTDENPSTAPSAREAPAMAFDSANGLVVLFGGYDTTYRGDTWVYNPNNGTWTQKLAGGGPSPRQWSGMTFDSTNGLMVLFGGVSAGGFENDTWEYDTSANTWTPRTPNPAPPQLVSYHLAFDSASGVQLSILAGRNFNTGAMVTWAYDAGTHTWADRAPSPNLPVRVSFAMGYHPGLDRVVVFGGVFPVPPPGTLQSDTYEYNWAANGWTQSTTTGPSARTAAGVTYRSDDAALYLFGGNGAGGVPLADTWRYLDNAGNHEWLSVPTQRNPSARGDFGIANEAPNGKSILFGGIVVGGGHAGDTWAFAPAYGTTGFWISQTFDSGASNVVWNTISFTPTTQVPNTLLQFQLAVSSAPGGPWAYWGPGCNAILYFEISPTSIDACFNNNRYLRVEARLLSFDNSVTPTLDSVTIDYTVPASAPYIILTDPADATLGVPQTQSVFVRFSETMDNSSLLYTINPSVPSSAAWSENDSAITITHTAPFAECKQITVTITQARDTSGNNLIPNPIDPQIVNPFKFVTECVYPWIQSTSPPSGDSNVSLSAPIVVDFSENMNTSSVGVVITPTLGLSRAWTNGTQRLTLSHSTNFTQCVVYTVNITGEDLAGNVLFPGPAPNPWSFQAHCTVPYIVMTNPSDREFNVAETRDIIVTFSEPMNVGTVTWTPQPPITLSPAWSNGNRILTLSHTAPFQTCTVYTMDVFGKDADEGFDLYVGQAPGGAVHPWKFMPTCPNPFLLFTDPADGDTNVDRSVNITVAFDEAMNTGTVTATISPTIVLVPNWNPQNNILTLSHTVPFGCGLNTVTIAGRDAGDNLPLVPGFVPNPFRFDPFCPNPTVQSTSPADGDTGVALDANVVVTFSKPMDRASVTFNCVPIGITFTPSWTVGNTTVTFTHATLFAQRTNYTCGVDGSDPSGNPLVPGAVPNPWRFQTVGVNPQILSTDPFDGAVDVPTTANVVVTFSQAMDTATVVVIPSPPIVLNYAWTNGSTVLILSHIAGFVECTNYTFNVTGRNPAGDPLAPGPVPNPWSFRIFCNAPTITDTNPASGVFNVALNAPIWVNFSKSMDTATVTAVLAPLAGTNSYSWSNQNRTVQITHSADFQACQPYTATVFGRDPSGNNLQAGPVPNPWSFTADCPNPFVVSTNPADNATNVPTTFSLVVTFNRAMDPATAIWSVVPTPAGVRTVVWTGGNTVATVSWSQPQQQCTLYSAQIRANAPDGKPLVPGPVPNPWAFTTVCTVPPPGGLTITRVAPDTIHLSWNASAGANAYRVYGSPDRFAAWPWNLLDNVTTTTYDAVGDLNDGATHYYLVRALRVATESLNSTMAVKIETSASFSASRTNVYWFSLPYRSQYTRASDIANELTSSKIDVIAKWNPATQSSIIYTFFRGQWRGTDFPINAGDGLWFSAVSTFTWVIVGTDRSPTLTFTHNNAPLQNINWRGIPYTGTYRSASDLVRAIEGGIGPNTNTKIVVVAKWNAATQSVDVFRYVAGGWTGTDFAINPGDGIYFDIVSSFTWQPTLVTPEVP